MLKELPQLAKGFRNVEAFQKEGYRLLPLRFLRFDSDRYVLTNMVGEYILLEFEEFRKFVRHELSRDTKLYADLKGKHFLVDGTSDVAVDLLAAKYRTKQSSLASFTALHLFVVSLRCDHSCPYCQVSRVSEDRSAFDMSEETAIRAVDLMFRSPSKVLKVEFQGGESLLNFSLIRFIVDRCRKMNDGREIEFVIATNLSPITHEILAYCRTEGIFISTSLDGPAELHNANRPRPGLDSHQRATSGIELARQYLGPNRVSALMTTTARSLTMPEAIVDEYVRLDFRSIFLRPISPYGFAVRSATKIGYETSAFLDFYKRGVEYILKLNRQGVQIREEYTSLVLQKALKPYATGYVDLQSPSGIGISVIVYNYDGDVYASDEGRMLAEQRDHTFRLGNVHRDTYENIFLDSGLLTTIYETMSEGIPGCSDCAYQPWCGTDPVFHHATQGDVVGIRPMSLFCQRNMGVFAHVLDLLDRGGQDAGILRGWVHA